MYDTEKKKCKKKKKANKKLIKLNTNLNCGG